MLNRLKRFATWYLLLTVALLISSCGSEFLNQNPTIFSLAAADQVVQPAASLEITCDARDADRDEVGYTWSANGGKITGTGAKVNWIAPETPGDFTVSVTVADGRSGQATSQVTFNVLSQGGRAPVIEDFYSRPSILFEGNPCTLICIASDPDGGALTYAWEVPGGSIAGEGASVVWTTPNEEGTYKVMVTVSDPDGNKRTKDTTIRVECACGR